MIHNVRRRRSSTTLRRLVVLAACAWMGVASHASHAAERGILDGWKGVIPSHIAWTLLAGVGLVAVAIAALSVRRPRRDDAERDVHEPVAPPNVVDAPAQRSVAASWSKPAASPATQTGAEAVIAAPTSSATSLLATVRTNRSDVDAPRPATTSTERPAASPPDAPLARASASPVPDAPANGSQLFLALHHVDLSIDVLHKHLVREPRPMPAVWLMLLDLCRTHGREQTFCELALEFHARFNVRTPAWDGFPPGRDEPGLEAYPRLVKEITLAWGTHECRRLLDRLLYDNRGGHRKGFTLNAYNDLIALRRAADAVLVTIEEDLAEEARLRSAFDSAASAASDKPDTRERDRSPLVRDLESQLDGDLAHESPARSAIEREHPALAGMLAREWGNAALSARLCEMLARGGDGMQPLSTEAADELELLRRMAERLSTANGFSIASATTAAQAV